MGEGLAMEEEIIWWGRYEEEHLGPLPFLAIEYFCSQCLGHPNVERKMMSNIPQSTSLKHFLWVWSLLLLDLHMVFIDLERAYDKVPRDLIWWTLEEKGATKRYIEMIQDMYSGAMTTVRTVIGKTNDFPITIGLHQGSALSHMFLH